MLIMGIWDEEAKQLTSIYTYKFKKKTTKNELKDESY